MKPNVYSTIKIRFAKAGDYIHCTSASNLIPVVNILVSSPFHYCGDVGGCVSVITTAAGI